MTYTKMMMDNKLKMKILVFLVSSLTLTTILLCLRNCYLSHKVKKLSLLNQVMKEPSSVKVTSEKEAVVTTTEILTTKEQFEKLPTFGNVQNPGKVVYWDSSLEPGEERKPTGEVENSIHSSSSGNEFYFRDFLKQGSLGFSSEKDSLIQLLLTRKSLGMSFYNQAADKYVTKSFPLDLERFQYNWTPESGLTYQRVRKPLELVPFISGRYDFFQKSMALGAGLSLRTTKLDYSISFNLGMANQQVQPGLELNLTYKLYRWQR